MRPAILIKTLLALTLIWSAVWTVRTIAGSLKTTATRVASQIEDAGFTGAPPTDASPALAATRETKLRQLATMINRLDYQERAAHRQLGTAARLFDRLTPPEQEIFVDLTITPALTSLLDSLESLPPKQRKRFIDQGIKELTSTSDLNPRLAESYRQSAKLVETLDIKHLRAWLNNAGPRLKFQLDPLVEAVNESLQGMNGPDFGPRRPH